jgi:hypothetical protein
VFTDVNDICGSTGKVGEALREQWGEKGVDSTVHAEKGFDVARVRDLFCGGKKLGG